MKNLILGVILLSSTSVFAESIDIRALNCEEDSYQEKAFDAVADQCLYRLCWAARFKKISLQYSDDLNRDRIRDQFVRDFTQVRDDSEETAQDHINYLKERCDAELSSDLTIEKTIVLSFEKNRHYPIVKQIKKKLKKAGKI